MLVVSSNLPQLLNEKRLLHYDYSGVNDHMIRCSAHVISMHDGDGDKTEHKWMTGRDLWERDIK